MLATTLWTLFALGLAGLFLTALGLASWRGRNQGIQQLAQDLRNGKLRGFAVVAVVVVYVVLVQVMK